LPVINAEADRAAQEDRADAFGRIRRALEAVDIERLNDHRKQSGNISGRVQQVVESGQRRTSCLEERIRQEPLQHLLMALVIGYLLQIIPFRSFLVLGLKLARPVLFLACAFQLAKYVSKGSNSRAVFESR
jgi:hypothetical protein